MTTGRGFYQWFENQSELDVARKVATDFPAPGSLPADEVSLLAENLLTMDEGHLATAIEVLAHHSPRRLVGHLNHLLVDSRAGVWTAAERALLLIPPDAVSSLGAIEILTMMNGRPGAVAGKAPAAGLNCVGIASVTRIKAASVRRIVWWMKPRPAGPVWGNSKGRESGPCPF